MIYQVNRWRHGQGDGPQFVAEDPRMFATREEAGACVAEARACYDEAEIEEFAGPAEALQAVRDRAVKRAEHLEQDAKDWREFATAVPSYPVGATMVADTLGTLEHWASIGATGDPQRRGRPIPCEIGA